MSFSLVKSLLYPCWGEIPWNKSFVSGFVGFFKAFFTVGLLLN